MKAIGLHWDDPCLLLEQNKRRVQAASKKQVRKKCVKEAYSQGRDTNRFSVGYLTVSKPREPEPTLWNFMD